MSHATGTSSARAAPRRRNPFAEFFVRLWREKRLGAASGIVVLLLILVAIFADALAPYPSFEVHPVDRLSGATLRYLLGTDQLGRDLLSRLIYGARLSLFRRALGNRAERGGRGRDRGHVGILRRQAGPAGAAIRRRLDGVSRLADIADRHVDRRQGTAADHSGAGDIGRHQRFAHNPKRRHRGQGERLFRGRGCDRQLEVERPHPPRAAQHRGSGDRDLQHQTSAA